MKQDLKKGFTRVENGDKNRAYQLRIQLKHLKPAIYRDVLVDPATPLPKLHRIIQAAMGWEDVHLHGFALPLKTESYWRVPGLRRFEKPSADGWGEPAQNESRFTVADLLQAPKSKLLYMYDFGDDWEHTVMLSAIVETNVPLPHLLKAQYGCPPEDCGGVPGLSHWAEVWHTPLAEDHAIAKSMFGDQEPGSLDFEALQKAVRKLQPKVKRKVD